MARPPRGQAAVAWLRGWLPGERSVKTALAAGLAWGAGALLGNPRPYFAPLAAILILQVTIAESVTRAVQRVLGVVVGVAVALLVGRVVGLTAWGIGILVLLSLAVGTRLRLGVSGIPQVAISGLLVLIIGSLTRTEYGLWRISETLVGAVVGVGVNALVVPPSHVPEARRALAGFAAAQAALFRGLAADLGAGWGPVAARARLEEARAMAGRVHGVMAAVARAQESLRYNPFGRRQRVELARLQGALRALERAAVEGRGMARTLHDAAVGAGAGEAGAATGAQTVDADGTAAAGAGAEVRRSVAGLLGALADGVDAFWAAVDGAPAAGAGVSAGAFAGTRAVAERWRGEVVREGGGASDWVWVGAIVTDAGRLLADLGEALREPSGAGGG